MASRSSVLPSVRGHVLALAVEDVNQLVAEGELEPRAFARWLAPDDLSLFAHEIEPAGWYDIRVVPRLLAMLRDVEGDGSDDYLRLRGARAFYNLAASPEYPQIGSLDPFQVERETDPEARYAALGRDPSSSPRSPRGSTTSRAGRSSPTPSCPAATASR